MDPLELEPVNTFGHELETLVITAYSTAVVGIDRLNAEWKNQFRSEQGSYAPEERGSVNQQWDDHLSSLRYHVANMSLVSLVILFDSWLHGIETELDSFRLLNKNKEKGHRSRFVRRFKRVEAALGKGPLNAKDVQEIVDARDAIVHHGSRPDFKGWGETIVVSDKFTGEVAGLLSVAVEPEVLIETTNQVRSQTELWFHRVRLKTRSR